MKNFSLRIVAVAALVVLVTLQVVLHTQKCNGATPGPACVPCAAGGCGRCSYTTIHGATVVACTSPGSWCYSFTIPIIGVTYDCSCTTISDLIPVLNSSWPYNVLYWGDCNCQ